MTALHVNPDSSDNQEKKLLDGFLAGRDRVQEDVEKSESQRKLL